MIMKRWSIRGLAPYIAGVTLVMLLVISAFNFLYEKKHSTGVIIADEVGRLADIFERIHASCTIISFDYQKNPINFLNVTAFVGSEVGPMNLANPERWEGPYAYDNPTMQGREYLIVRTKQGHFITPGEGVELPNGKIVGTDIVLDENIDLDALSQSTDGFMYRERSLAAKLPF